jgi:hypothetical protein
LLLLDGDLTPVMPHVVVYPRSQEILMIQRILHSPHLVQRLDLYVFELFTILHKKEHKVIQMKEKTLKIYPVILIVDQTMIIGTIR